jgi:hypothetical protein
VTGSAPLERLKDLVNRLMTHYQWREDTGTMFVLTGQKPLRWPMRVSVEASNLGTSIRIDAEPWVPSAMVRSAYDHARSRGDHRRRVPRVSEKCRAVVAFVNARGGKPSRELCRQWNREHRAWRYADEANVIHDYRRTAGHL